ncbi:MAG TPA: NAD(P)-dependent oxidoreductase [Streptosporangiaceae bacterium]|nr:NAD(P)-dependent oxidoreductase [Streptosporangiaceae bacterium]
MTATGHLRILAVGDPFMPVSVFTSALAAVGDAVSVTALQIEDAAAPPSRTASEERISEYAGDPAVIAAAVAGHDILVVHGAPVTAEVLDSAPLRLVGCARGGPVNVDIDAATVRGIPVTNSPGKNAEAVAELTLTFALMLIRGVPSAARFLLDGGRHADNAFEGGQFTGGEAASMTLGLVGLGHVGRAVAVRARALGFSVIAHDPVPPRIVPAGVSIVSFDEVLARSDIVSVHARASAGNRHLFSTAAFARMPRGSYFINTAREALVDEDALLDALTRGALAGAALDVAERPAGGSRHPLLDLPNVIMTPHIGGATKETLQRGADMLVAAIAQVLAGEEPDYLLNPDYQARKAAVS